MFVRDSPARALGDDQDLNSPWGRGSDFNTNVNLCTPSRVEDPEANDPRPDEDDAKGNQRDGMRSRRLQRRINVLGCSFDESRRPGPVEQLCISGGLHMSPGLFTRETHLGPDHTTHWTR